MKKSAFWLLLAMVGVLIGYQLAQASPFLTCDPYRITDPGKQPDNFTLIIDDGLPITTVAFILANGDVVAMNDLYGVDLTLTHTFSLKACNIALCSPPTIYNYAPASLYPRPPGALKIIQERPQ